MLLLTLCPAFLIGLAGPAVVLPTNVRAQETARAQSAPRGTPQAQRQPDTSDIWVPDGYSVEVAARNLDYPGDMTFGPDGTMYVAEVGGHTYGTAPKKAPPSRILKIAPDGNRDVLYDKVVPMKTIRQADFGESISEEGLIPPITGITYNEDNGLLYISHRSRYSTLDPETGEFNTIIDGLPVWGEFLNGKPIFGPDGDLYFALSTQGNSGNVDGHMMKVMKAFDKPGAREIPCEDVRVTGLDFWLKNKLTPEQNDSIRAEVYAKLGRDTQKGEVIEGQFWCHGAMYRANPDGSDPERLAWGLRSLYGYGFSPEGRLLATQNSGNIMQPRPIYDDWESVYEIVDGGWYGWPDYYSGLPVTQGRFARPNEPEVKKSFDHDFALTRGTRDSLMGKGPLPVQPLVRLPIHSAAEGMVFGNEAFGIPEGEMLVAEFGAIIDYYAEPASWPGFRIQRVNPWTGEVSDFMINRSRKPAWATGGGGLRRPIMPVWGPNGALYVVDFGVIHFTEKGMRAEPGTGVIWKVTRTEQ